MKVKVAIFIKNYRHASSRSNRRRLGSLRTLWINNPKSNCSLSTNGVGSDSKLGPTTEGLYRMVTSAASRCFIVSALSSGDSPVGSKAIFNPIERYTNPEPKHAFLLDELPPIFKPRGAENK